MNKEDRPFVSALLVTRNEQRYIEQAILSLIHQSYPKERYEIIVIDGESSDQTIEIVEKLIKVYNTEYFDMRLLNNPSRVLAAGWNIGIKAAKGEFVIRIDAHAKAEADVIEKSVDTLLSIQDAVCVGGKLITQSIEGDNGIIAKVLSSPFGVGNSSFRVSDVPGYADTAVYGLYRKDIFEKVGYFNEHYTRNQDIELHARIKKAGYKFYFNPTIVTTYYSRNTISKMMSQAYGNGMWNMVLIKNRSAALSIRHIIPFVFVSYLLISMALGFVHRFFWIQEAAVVILHLSLGVLQAIKKTNHIKEIILMPWLFMLLHISYGTGYLAGLFKSID